MKKLLRQGFTLIELLTVIAIIGILAVALLPAIQGAILKAKVAAAAGGMSKISTAYISMTTGERPRTISENTIHDAARHVAQYGDLNDPAPWLIKSDPRVEAKMAEANFPAVVADKATTAGEKWTVNSDFKAYQVSLAVANKTPSNAAETTPIIWTRGLKGDGTWDKDESVFGTEYGLILFKSGQVRTYKNADLAENGGGLITYGSNSNTPTKDINQAIHKSANVLESK